MNEQDQPTEQKSYGKKPVNSTDFRAMAKAMNKLGFKMNHASARNYFISAMKELITETARGMEPKKAYNIIFTKETIEEMLMPDDFHEWMSDVLFSAVHGDEDFARDLEKLKSVTINKQAMPRKKYPNRRQKLVSVKRTDALTGETVIYDSYNSAARESGCHPMTVRHACLRKIRLVRGKYTFDLNV